ncbi:hypothetical protein [Flavobacterium sp. NKUCC04_CG]|uniref:hypothetical protein n=1 Tax=Flavobacterium sp. NKUCC04_CG TaxID=2842121 RepID=UPI001C5B6729|nr:hypothetical protein [Flavobacterium sp. NKUCC04_CG]MBW3520421.1 hypothetical protein [Flavobacterium sp. NKUCC04_CG]
MELVRGKRTISLSKKGDSLTTGLIADKPLVAKYQDGVVIGSWVTPANNRTVYAQVLTSLSNTPVSTTGLTAVKWKFNGLEIADSDTRFEKTTYSIGSTVVPALKIKADIMSALLTTSSIEFTASAYTGGYTTAVNAAISVSKENVSANTYTAYIIDQNGRGAAITALYPTVTLEAILEKGGIPQTTGITYQWFKTTLDPALDLANDPVADNRMLLTGKTQKTITLTADDIATYDTYSVDIFENALKVKTAIISVRDETDTLELLYGVQGSEDDLEVAGQVKYIPKVVLRGTTTIASGNWTFAYQKIKIDGTLLGPKGTGATYTVTGAQVSDAGGEIALLFEATEV